MTELQRKAEQIRQRWRAGDAVRDAGLTVPETVRCRYDLPYGSEPVQRLDVYRPKDAEGELPVIVSVHGGGFIYGDRALYRFYCMELARRGFAVINFDYPLAPEAPYPAALRSVNAVMHWLVRRGRSEGIDPDRVFLTGDSAGAHLACQYAAAASNPDYAQLLGLSMPALTLRGAALNCGIYDRIASLDQTTVNCYLGPPEQRSEALRRELDVLSFLTADFPPAFVMTAVGDYLRPCAAPLAQALRAKGVPVRLEVYGTEDEPLCHVFHCNVRLPAGQRCNEDECAFFRSLLTQQNQDPDESKRVPE